MATGTKRTRSSHGRTSKSGGERQGRHSTAEAKANRKGSENRCWRGYVPVAGKKAGARGSCRKASKGVNHSKV